MAHCPFELLDDLGDVLAEVRSWAGVKEKSRGWVSRLSLRRRLRAHYRETGAGA